MTITLLYYIKSNVYFQVKSMGKILGSEKQAKYNFKEKSDSYLTPGFLTSQGDFFFANQQEAT